MTKMAHHTHLHWRWESLGETTEPKWPLTLNLIQTTEPGAEERASGNSEVELGSISSPQPWYSPAEHQPQQEPASPRKLSQMPPHHTDPPPLANSRAFTFYSYFHPQQRLCGW